MGMLLQNRRRRRSFGRGYDAAGNMISGAKPGSESANGGTHSSPSGKVGGK